MRVSAEGRAPWTIFWTGLALRIGFLTLAHTYRLRLTQDHFHFGWEMGRIARSLATGHGYASPFVGPSGPTAWCPPLYPLLLAGVFKLCGVYTALSAWVILAINSVFSAYTAILIYEIALRCYTRKIAIWSAWLWALYPAAMQYAVHWVWDMAITACLFSAILVIALRVRGIGSPDLATRREKTLLWASFGVLWGAIAMLNPSLLTFLPFAALWMFWGERHALVAGLARAALAALLCAACIAPWVARNWIVFHVFIPTRPNLGCELYPSSLAINNGFPWGDTVSVFADTPDMQRYRALGEVAFCKERGQMAQAVFRAHPGRFERYALKRVVFFWDGVPHPVDAPTPKNMANEFFRQLNYCLLSATGLLGLGLALARRTPAAWLWAGAFLIIPLVFYTVTVQARFRSPLEPLICILSVYLFQSADRTRIWSIFRRTA